MGCSARFSPGSTFAFSIYINDAGVHGSIKLITYANYRNLICTNDNINHLEVLTNTSTNCVIQYFNEHFLILNTSKSALIHFSSNGKSNLELKFPLDDYINYLCLQLAGSVFILGILNNHVLRNIENNLLFLLSILAYSIEILEFT